MRCGVCGCQITAERKLKHYKQSGRTVTYTYYHCTGRKGCLKDSISEAVMRSESAIFFRRFRWMMKRPKSGLRRSSNGKCAGRQRPATVEFNQNRIALAKTRSIWMA